MKIKTSELEGMALCYTLCMIEMPHLVWGETIGEHHASRQISPNHGLRPALRRFANRRDNITNATLRGMGND